MKQRVFAVLDILDKSVVDCLLHESAFSVHNLLLCTFREECLCVGLLGLVVSGEQLVGDLGDINASGRNFGACC